MTKIKYLCTQISKIEWSGLLIYKVHGDITDPANCELKVLDVVPMDQGSAAYTEYELDPEVVMEFLMDHPEYEDCSIGHIHSHHTMSTFFSVTDVEELQDNAPNHNLYLSLIVNNEDYEKWDARMAFVGTVVEHNISFRDQEGENVNIGGDPTPKEMLVYYQCDIQEERHTVTLPQDFLDAVVRIKKPKFTTNAYNKGWVTPTIGLGKLNAPSEVQTPRSQRARVKSQRSIFEDASFYEDFTENTETLEDSSVAYALAISLLNITTGLEGITNIAVMAETIASRFPSMIISRTCENIDKSILHKYRLCYPNDILHLEFADNMALVATHLQEAIMDIKIPLAEDLLEGLIVTIDVRVEDMLNNSYL